MTCQICGYQMDAFDEECPRCHGRRGQSLPIPVSPPPPVPPSPPPHYNQLCTHCGAKMSASTQVCPNCHKSNISPATPLSAISKQPVYIALAGVAGLAGLFFLNSVFSGIRRSINPPDDVVTPTTSSVQPSSDPNFAPPVAAQDAASSLAIQNSVLELQQLDAYMKKYADWLALEAKFVAAFRGPKNAQRFPTAIAALEAIQTQRIGIVVPPSLVHGDNLFAEGVKLQLQTFKEVQSGVADSESARNYDKGTDLLVSGIREIRAQSKSLRAQIKARH